MFNETQWYVYGSLPSTNPQPALAEKLFALADGMQDKIDSDLNPGSAQQNYTARRERIVQGMRERGYKAEKVQAALRALGDAHLTGDCPMLLFKVANVASATRLMEGQWSWDQKVGLRLGLPDEAAFRAAQRLLKEIAQPKDRSAEIARQEFGFREQSLIRQIPGFFPTPEAVAEYAAELLGDMDDKDVLEPSFGTGRLIWATLQRWINANVVGVELRHTLHEMFNTVHDGREVQTFCADVMEWEPDYQFDGIIMNPDFSKKHDSAEIMRVWPWLKSGGRLVAIVARTTAENPNGKTEQALKSLLDAYGYTERLDDEAFKDSQTLVKTNIIVLDKP